MRHRYDYSRKSYVRPRRRRQLLAAGLLKRRWWQALAVALVLVAVLNVGSKAARWSVSAVQVHGAKLIAADQVAAAVREQVTKRRWLVLPQRVKAFFDLGALRQTLERRFPFASWQVDKDAGGAVLVTVRERQAELVWVAQGKTFYADANGLLFSNVSAASSAEDASDAVIRHQALVEGLPVVVDESSESASLGTVALTAPTVGFIRAVADAVSNGRMKLPTAVTGYRFDRKSFRLTVQTIAGYDIFFASHQPIDEQLAKLNVAMQQGIGRRKDLDYLDVRFGQKVFYQ